MSGAASSLRHEVLSRGKVLKVQIAMRYTHMYMLRFVVVLVCRRVVVVIEMY